MLSGLDYTKFACIAAKGLTGRSKLTFKTSSTPRRTFDGWRPRRTCCDVTVDGFDGVDGRHLLRCRHFWSSTLTILPLPSLFRRHCLSQMSANFTILLSEGLFERRSYHLATMELKLSATMITNAYAQDV